MTLTQILPPTDYQALRNGAALQLRPTAGLLVLTGADRSDFLHRMTTNNISALKPGQSTVTVLTSPTARILFVFTVICRDDELWVAPAAGEGQTLARHLRGQIFFMDKVHVRDDSEKRIRARLMGSQADAVLANIGIESSQLHEGDWQKEQSTGLVAVKQFAYDVPGYELILEKDFEQDVLAQLVEKGAMLLEDQASYDAYRITLGRPAPGYELTSDHNPLEAGMAWVCADNKGCYTGQEIIARQITYDKVTKRLVGLRSDQPLKAGSTVTANGQVVGTVTSTGHDLASGTSIALSIVKRPHHAPGAVIMCGEIPAKVVELPFVTMLDS